MRGIRAEWMREDTEVRPMMLQSGHSRDVTGFQITASRTRFEYVSLTGKLTEGRVRPCKHHRRRERS